MKFSETVTIRRVRPINYVNAMLLGIVLALAFYQVKQLDQNHIEQFSLSTDSIVRLIKYQGG